MTQAVSVTVPSATGPGSFYVVSRVNGFAVYTCKGFEHRGRCKHLAFAPTSTDLPVRSADSPLCGVRQPLELPRSRNAPREADEACGICDQVHDCHCPRLQTWSVCCAAEVA